MKKVDLPEQGPKYAALVASEVRGQAARRRVASTRLARGLNLSPQAMSRRMTGQQAFDVAELLIVAEILGCDVRELLPPQQRTAAQRGGAQVTGDYRASHSATLLQFRPRTKPAIEYATIAPVIHLADRRQAVAA